MVELIYDVHASESGALAILTDLYQSIRKNEDKSIKYVFIVSTPAYEEDSNICILRYPWIKKSWLHRLFFEYITTRQILREYKPDKVYSLQNRGISFFNGEQKVYLHLSFILCDYRFRIWRDGKRLWFYQNIFSKSIFISLRKVNKVIVQTQWMKDALIQKAQIDGNCIIIESPNIPTNLIGNFIDIPENRRRFFYPATAFHYKNHVTLIKAVNYAANKGLSDYEVILTITPEENRYTRQLSDYVKEHHLNIRFVGMISREEVFALYTQSVLLFPSFVESFGLPLLEARMSGAYVIASDCPFSREILDGYDKAAFFEAMDFENMGKLICAIAD